MTTDPVIGYGLPRAGAADLIAGPLNIVLIDSYRLTQECLTKAFDDMDSGISIFGCLTVTDCIAEAQTDLDLIIYHPHGIEVLETTIMQASAAICLAFPDIPVIIFSDADVLQQSQLMHAALQGGARGFVPTQTASLSIALAAIHLVKAGGTFAPVDLLMSTRPARSPERRSRLTSRQEAVLSQLRQGKTNRIIAYELGMTESTVKVHVRNIMRKLGAANRTEAVYKARMLAQDTADTKSADP
jgi:DNA-binding NarL/FixJ family response regulator